MMLYFLYAGITLSLILAVVYSVKARRAADAKKRGLHAARMNLSIGTLMMLFAFVQLVLFEPDTIRIIVGSAFFLIGFFNLFAGLRNYGYYSRFDK